MSNNITATTALFFIAILGVIVFLTFGWLASEDQSVIVLKLSKPEAADVGASLLTFLLIALFIEPEVEVYTSVWRERGRRKQLANLVASTPDTKSAALSDFEAFRADTQFRANIISVALGFAVALSGVQALAIFLDASSVGNEGICISGSVCAGSVQTKFFMTVDILLTAALLGGGADGIHKVVNAFTSYSDAATARALSYV